MGLLTLNLRLLTIPQREDAQNLLTTVDIVTISNDAEGKIQTGNVQSGRGVYNYILFIMLTIYYELITRESETILPLFLPHSFLSSSLVFGIKIYKTVFNYQRGIVA